MDVLVVGGGGREHTLAWKLGQSPLVETVYCAPGNTGMRDVVPVPLTKLEDLRDFALEHDIGLTMIGPEAPLCAGIVDLFREAGLCIFGPTREAARLEGSKSFAKAFMKRHGIPTAAAWTFTEREPALAKIREIGAPIVIKADGLAAGKGVVVADSVESAEEAVTACFDGAFGDAGSSVLVEECLVGEEASILAFSDGKTIIPLASSQDHKRVGDGDRGPNTGGMGAYSPAPVVTEAMWRTIEEKVLEPFRAGCVMDGLDYRGVIYAGIMVTEEGPKVLEFNVRFGDPETQAVLMRLDSDLAEALKATAEGRLGEIEPLQWTSDAAVCVVMASGGYPGTYEKGHVIRGLEEAEATGAVVFHAGTGLDAAGNPINQGGRVLGVTARGGTIATAVENAYRAVDCISWKDAYWRRDIAHRALNRQL